MRNSDCTSCELTADKSAYWTPQLYYQHSNGLIEEVPNSGMVVYYLGRGVNSANIQPFPPGFKMLSGASGARAYDNKTMTWGNATYPPRPVADRVSFNCLNYTGSGNLPETPGMSQLYCEDGLRAQLQFQSCWNGVDLYKSDNSHVAYMSQIDNGVCPPGYPVQLVHLFYEVLYGVSQINQSGGGQFVFSNGDPTGFGFHGDFMNGWDQTVLGAALAGGANSCANVDNNGQIAACPPLAAVDTTQYANNCPEYPAVVNETVKGIIGTKLPGCNNIVYGPAPAQASDLNCPAGAPTPSINVLPVQTPQTILYPTPSQAVGLTGWNYVDCFTDLVNSNGARTLSAASTSNATQSIEACQAFCTAGGYRYAGLEYAQECYCQNAILPLAKKAQSTCVMTCAGNRTEICGGPNAISIYNNTLAVLPPSATVTPGAGPTPAAAGTYLGCATDPNQSGRALTGASYADGKNMTLEGCRAFCDTAGFRLSGTEYSGECYCGNSLVNGGALLQDNATCSMYCSGAQGETCGGPNRLSLFNSTNYHPITAPQTIGAFAYQGCYAEGTYSRALRDLTYRDGSAMTAESCVAFCGAKGFAYAGAEYATECWCGHTLYGNGPVAATDCNMQCSGNSREWCGGPSRLSLYYNASAGAANPGAVTQGRHRLAMMLKA